MERTAAIRLQDGSKQQQPIIQEDHPDIRSKVDIAIEAFRSAEIRFTHLREKEEASWRKMKTIRETRSSLNDALLREFKMYRDCLESLVFYTDDVQAEIKRRRETIESIKVDLEEAEKNFQSALTEESNVSECCHRALEDLAVAREQQCAIQSKLKELVCDQKSKPLFYKKEVIRFPFLTEKMELCKKLNSCLLKIAEELRS